MKRFLNVFVIISLCFLTACSSKGLSKDDTDAIYQEAYAAGYRDGFADGSKQVAQTDNNVNRSAVTGNIASTVSSDAEANTSENVIFVLNTKKKKIHLPNCPSAKQIADHNYQESDLSYDELIKMNYSPCGNCHPERDQ